MSITGMQIRLARAALRWRIDDLATHTGVAWARLQNVERTDDIPSANAEVMEAIKSAFEDNGIEFIEAEDSHYAAIRVKKP